jgi:hypothetical protein
LILSGKLNRTSIHEDVYKQIWRGRPSENSESFSLSYRYCSEVITAHSVGRLPMPSEFVIVLRERVKAVRVQFNRVVGAWR